MNPARPGLLFIDGEPMGEANLSVSLAAGDQAGSESGRMLRASLPPQGSIELKVTFDKPDPEKQIEMLATLVASDVDPRSGYLDECVELGKAWWRSFLAKLGRPLSWHEAWLIHAKLTKRMRVARRDALLAAFELELRKFERDELDGRYESVSVSIFDDPHNLDRPYRLPAWARAEREGS